MSDDRQFERDARAWLELGPTDAPDRVVENALLTIESTPQERDLRIPWRVPRMTTMTRLTTAAVIGALAIGGGLLLLQGPLAQVGGPSPSPTARISPSPNPSALALALEAHWISAGGRQDPVGVTPYPHDMDIGPTNVSLNEFKGPITSSWSFVGPGTIKLRIEDTQQYLTGAHWDTCHPGDEGTYGLNLSSDGGDLRLRLLVDPCAPRATILAGNWVHTDIGNLAPGRHQPALFRPFAGATSGQFAYTVPPAWAEAYECESCFILMSPNAPNQWAVEVLSNVVPYSDCGPSAAGVGSTSAAIVPWLATLPGLVMTTPTPISIGGLSGVMVDLSVAPGYINRCSYSQSGGPSGTLSPPVYDSPLTTFRDLGSNGSTMGLLGTGRARYILLDRGDGGILLIDIDGPDKATWDAAIAASMPIVTTFEFIPEAP